MKHEHSANATVKVDIPTQDLEVLIDKVTESALTIIAALTVASILKSIFRGES